MTIDLIASVVPVPVDHGNTLIPVLILAKQGSEMPLNQSWDRCKDRQRGTRLSYNSLLFSSIEGENCLIFLVLFLDWLCHVPVALET